MRHRVHQLCHHWCDQPKRYRRRCQRRPDARPNHISWIVTNIHGNRSSWQTDVRIGGKEASGHGYTLWCGSEECFSVCRQTGSRISTGYADSMSVAGLLAQGAALGSCFISAGAYLDALNKLQALLLPNPSADRFGLHIQSLNTAPVTVRIISESGSVLDQYARVQPGARLDFGRLYPVRALPG